MLDEVASAAADSVTVTSTESFGSRLMSSFVGVLIGIALFLGSFYVLWWNEGNVIAEKNALDEMRKSVVKVSADAPSKANNNKLVHASGKLSSVQKIGDPPYLAPANWLKLERKVEMYQWVEESKTRKVGNRRETTYSYKKEWASGRKESDSFQKPQGHLNPQPSVEPAEVKVTKSTFGKFDGTAVLANIDEAKTLPVTAAMLANKKKPQEIKNGMLYLRVKAGSKEDQIGDVRLSYTALSAGTFSIIAKQTGNTFAPHHAKNGKENFLVSAGTVPPQKMVAAAKDAAGTFAMVVRVIGFILMWFGLNLLAGPLTTVLDVIPFIGSASRLVLAAVFFVVAAVLSAATILVSMIAHSPIMLGAVVVLVIGVGFWAMQKKKQKQMHQAHQRGMGQGFPQHQPQRSGHQSRAA